MGSPRHDLQRATRMLHQGKFTEALRILQSLQADHPNEFGVVYVLGVALMIIGDLDSALTNLIHASALRPGDIKTSNAVGIVLARKGEYERALEHFDWSLKIDPTDVEAIRCRGGALAELGRFDEAIEQWKQMNEGAYRSTEVQFGLGQIYEQQGYLTKAAEHYRRVLRSQGETEFHEAAREKLVRIIPTTLGLDSAIRMNVVMYCLSAITLFTGMDRKKLHMILLEMALVGRHRLDVNDVTTAYRMQSMKASFNGLQIISYIYTGFRIMGDVMDMGVDISREYQVAMVLWSNDSHE